jgi:hypothetical protein
MFVLSWGYLFSLFFLLLSACMILRQHPPAFVILDHAQGLDCLQRHAPAGRWGCGVLTVLMSSDFVMLSVQ